uniref:uncharacterized protein LOC122610628 n=1 Tax=Erigeron canadensis TaxID=72917 RepID=UPI001CB8C3A2|nr:uncharacterized protein LOC122610628 [Erigeron canadensis]
MRKFLWDGASEAKKIHWISWEKVVMSIKSVRGVWASIVKTINKVKVADMSLNHWLKGVLGNSSDIRVWMDIWACNQPLKDVFPRLFQLEVQKYCKVSDKVDSNTNTPFLFDMGMVVLSGVETREEKEKINRLLEGKMLHAQRDRWVWAGAKFNVFMVKGVKDFLRSDNDYSNNFVFKWSKWVAKKCNVFMWRLGLNRLPTRMALKDKNCCFDSLMCGLCDKEEEDVDHLFSFREMAMGIWQRIGRWCKRPPLFLFSYRDIFYLHHGNDLGKETRKVFKGIVFVLCWCI